MKFAGTLVKTICFCMMVFVVNGNVEDNLWYNQLERVPNKMQRSLLTVNFLNDKNVENRLAAFKSQINPLSTLDPSKNGGLLKRGIITNLPEEPLNIKFHQNSLMNNILPNKILLSKSYETTDLTEEDDDLLGDEENQSTPNERSHLTCGNQKFDPIKQLCYEGKTYSTAYFGICGKLLYKIQTQFCYQGKTYSRIRNGICGNEIFDLFKQTCQMGKVSQLCGGEIYEPSTHFCVESVYSKSKFELCGKKIIRRKTHFCYNNIIYKNVESIAPIHNFPSSAATTVSSFNRNIPSSESHKSLLFFSIPTSKTLLPNWIPTESDQSIQFFVTNERNTHFNIETPTPATQVSQHRKMVNLIYNPTLSIYQNLNERKNTAVMGMFGEEHGEKKDILFINSKCGAFHYNNATHFCFKNQVTPRCGFKAFNVDALLCFNGLLYSQKVYQKCGENLINIFTKLCYNGNVYENSSDRKKLY
ncbi:uncharacterized protein LOC100199010 [Hydra vulgaris]|uniref:Uncharacterized protein LOC100199010 n=1 Tax=Hydra vulgaris TaxID=6087 RepID=A0ABM4DLG7_HYDVU